MGEKDTVEKTLLAYNDVFADIVNAIIFNGEDVVKESDLSDVQTESMYKVFEEIKSQLVMSRSIGTTKIYTSVA